MGHQHRPGVTLKDKRQKQQQRDTATPTEDPKSPRQIAPTIPFGGEDDTLLVPADATTHAIAWFDLIATPEAESQGRFVQQLAAAMPAGASVVVLIDEATFVRRFVNMPERLQQRRDVWRTFCESLGTPPVFSDLESSDGSATAVSQSALQSAMARPVQGGVLAYGVAT